MAWTSVRYNGEHQDTIIPQRTSTPYQIKVWDLLTLLDLFWDYWLDAGMCLIVIKAVSLDLPYSPLYIVSLARQPLSHVFFLASWPVPTTDWSVSLPPICATGKMLSMPLLSTDSYSLDCEWLAPWRCHIWQKSDEVWLHTIVIQVQFQLGMLQLVIGSGFYVTKLAPLPCMRDALMTKC